MMKFVDKEIVLKCTIGFANGFRELKKRIHDN